MFSYRIAPAICVATLFACAPVFADVLKCRDQSGEIVFTNTQCPEGSKLEEVQVYPQETPSTAAVITPAVSVMPAAAKPPIETAWARRKVATRQEAPDVITIRKAQLISQFGDEGRRVADVRPGR